MPKTQGVKPGYRTTEFGLTLAAVLTNAVLASELLAPASPTAKALAAISAALASLGYTISRTMVKR